MNLGKRIRATRIKLGLSQPRLAKLAKMNVMTISRYETGVRKGLRVSSLLKLAVALKTSPEYLVYGNRHKPINEADGSIKKLVDACKVLSPNDIKKLIATAKALQK
jgi:transcriptional regulator with XRE-family HTH domain